MQLKKLQLIQDLTPRHSCLSSVNDKTLSGSVEMFGLGLIVTF